MLTINIFGDFVTSSDNVKISRDLGKIIEEGDINAINIEAPCIDPNNKYKAITKSGSVLKQPLKSSEWIEKNGFDLVTLSNNHLMDYGSDGLLSTLSAFKNIHACGAGDWENAYKPLIVDSSVGKIAFLSLSHCEFGVLNDSHDTKNKYGVAWINHPAIPHIILQTKKECKYLFVIAHAGIENIEQPLPEWRDCYKGLIDIGADAVIGSHPHIPQGWEFYKGKPIVYSLGNFYFESVKEHNWNWFVSLCAHLIVSEEGIKIKIIPLRFKHSTIDIDESERTKQYLNRVNRILNDEKQYLDYINTKCNELWPLYSAALSIGGWECVYPPVKFIKRVIKKLLGRADYIPTHLINNLRCESHRWLIIRAIKNNLNIQ
ncbi:MAG: CapA family protein [Muribaculum sp.]|nr:CapA family protein [Muribaculum sp.]